MYVFLIIGIVVVILIFATVLNIPFFSSTKHSDMPLVIEALDLQNDQVVFDLGAGQGNLIFAAAAAAHHKKLNTVFYALEINSVALILMTLRAFFHPHSPYIRIRHANIFKYHYAKRIDQYKKVTFYLYIAPWLIPKAAEEMKKLTRPATVISYKYQIDSMELSRKVDGANGIFIYELHPHVSSSESTTHASDTHYL